MSNSLARASRTGAGAGVAPTRQQLDELDALLQRMLDLPVNQVDETAEEPASGLPPILMPPEPPAEKTPAVRPALASYIVVETASPAYHTQTPAEPLETLGPRVLPPPRLPRDESFFEDPVPGGRHDLGEERPLDPAEELAVLRARLEQP